MPATTRSDYEVVDRVAIVKVNRAPVNAVDHPMIDGIHAAMRRADADKEVGALIVTSALDGREGLMAFLEKRRAKWTGH